MICVKCNEERGSEFYGKDKTCKECRKAAVRANRKANIDYYREYDRARGNRPDRVKARKEYQKTEAGRDAGNRAKRKWAKLNQVKRIANILVGNAVRDGRLNKPDRCEECGSIPSRLHGHHDDYAFLLQVRWLCPACHSAWHKINGEAKNAS